MWMMDEEKATSVSTDGRSRRTEQTAWQIITPRAPGHTGCSDTGI